MTSVNHLNPSGSTISDEYNTENCFLSCDLFKQPQTIWSLRCRHVWLCFMWRLTAARSSRCAVSWRWRLQCGCQSDVRTLRSSDMWSSSSLRLLKVDSSRRMLLSAVRRVWDREQADQSAPESHTDSDLLVTIRASINHVLLHVNLFSVYYQYIATYCNVYNTI